MNKTKRAKLEARGWAVGDAKDFLRHSPEEAAFVEFKLSLSEALRTRREGLHLSQVAVAKRLGSSQSRVALHMYCGRGVDGNVPLQAGTQAVAFDIQIVG
jgi:hypothetical protein